MPRISFLFLLLIHLNSSVFIAQFEELDRLDKNGVQVDDINSLSEFVYEVILGHSDSTPEDEDDDHARVFHILKVHNFFYQKVVAIKSISRPAIPVTSEHKLTEEKITCVFFDIESPPPKA